MADFDRCLQIIGHRADYNRSAAVSSSSLLSLRSSPFKKNIPIWLYPFGKPANEMSADAGIKGPVTLRVADVLFGWVNDCTPCGVSLKYIKFDTEVQIYANALI